MHQDTIRDVIINYLAIGIVQLYESHQDEVNSFNILNNKYLRRACNVLAAQNVMISDRTELINILAKPIQEWMPNEEKGVDRYKGYVLIENGMPSDFACQLALGAEGDVRAELEQHLIVDIKRLLIEKNAPSSVYVEIRRFLIEHPIATDAQLKGFVKERGLFNSELQEIYALIYEFYEEIPNHYITKDTNEVEVCHYCGWTIYNGKEKHCISPFCNANKGIEHLTKIHHVTDMKRLKKGPMRYIAYPGIPELGIEKKLKKLKLNVEMYPNFDRYDLKIAFLDGETWALDVKDYANPYMLVKAVTEISANECTKSFVVVPNTRTKVAKDYSKIIKSAEPKNFQFITERELMKLVREKIANEKL